MHLRACQKSGEPSRSLRVLSTSTTCNSPPRRGPWKCEVYCVIGEPRALRESIRMKTPRSRARGISFSMPMLAMYRPTMGAAKMHMLRMSGVGVTIAATIKISRIA